jgi:hypothetical protein
MLTDEELTRLDLPALLERALADKPGGQTRRALSAEGAVAAAIVLGRLGVLPRSVAFLAAVVRAGGVAFAADQAEPLPTAEAAQLVLGWLHAALRGMRSAVEARRPAAGGDDEAVARWLEAVALLITLRQNAREAASSSRTRP